MAAQDANTEPAVKRRKGYFAFLLYCLLGATLFRAPSSRKPSPFSICRLVFVVVAGGAVGFWLGLVIAHSSIRHMSTVDLLFAIFYSIFVAFYAVLGLVYVLDRIERKKRISGQVAAKGARRYKAREGRPDPETPEAKLRKELLMESAAMSHWSKSQIKCGGEVEDKDGAAAQQTGGI